MAHATKDASYWGKVHIQGDLNPPLPVMRSAGEPIRYPTPLRALRWGLRARVGGGPTC
jgi:hypothetical protein